MNSSVAVISLGGKQHLVSQGATVVVNKLSAKVGEIFVLPDLLGGPTVQAKVLSHQLGKKVNGLKFKAKTRYFKRYGHRQSQTSVEIVSIGSVAEKSGSEPIKPVAKKPMRAKKVATARAKKAVDGKI